MAANLGDLRKFLDRLNRDVVSTSTMRELGMLGRDIIFKRVKTGFGVNSERTPNPSLQRLKRLSPRYIEQRRRQGVGGSFGSPGRSNLTNTGEMLDSMEVKVFNDSNFEILIPNSLRKDKKLNSRIAEFVEKQGRPFFALTPDEQQILVKEIEDKIRKALNSTLR